MVAQRAASWLPVDFRLPAGPQATLGILAFEAAAAMSRLLSLHRSLSEQEVSRLRSDAMRSPGVAYLNSTDQAFLLRLACAELVASLDAAAAAVARLGLRCGIDFGGVYASVKAGGVSNSDARLDPLLAGKGGLKVKAKKMERLVAATSKLCSEMEALDELEAAERKLATRGWSRLSGPIPAKLAPDPPPCASDPLGAESIRQEIKTQQLKVRRLKEESLWSQSYEKAVGLMARAACAVFARICTVFGQYVPGLPPAPTPSSSATTSDRVQTRIAKLLNPRTGKAKASSGPMLARPSRVHPPAPLSSSCPIIGTIRPYSSGSGQKPGGTDWRKLLDAPPSTVGGAGLDQQYANVIASAEQLLQMEAEGRQEEANAERAEMYEMLPGKLRAAVRSKLRDWWRRDPGPLDDGLAEGWKEAVGRIMAWLGPMARDTVQWQAERNMDRTRRFDGGTRVYALQTLRWADKEKAEAAIVEVLVALSCVCWYEERRRGSVRL
ncbi:uncharacterized protein LOC100846283 [Brachypodium distachyon]|uniref:DUF668 domain-containing protein n=1 Tax=Brachypodium distachyon TaxID=15368 RepID=I1HTB6_BRADI|nr:uncharacterized protein LOC100846283 [Brachypodium distachyon]KQK10543.1 hypothetical protein BRADI_2g54800v3 [Brachypodium distachyon]|eukprot:XP_003564597.1 uncharacterized protein LOC100846283 [Brachypodium distachyon]